MKLIRKEKPNKMDKSLYIKRIVEEIKLIQNKQFL